MLINADCFCTTVTEATVAYYILIFLCSGSYLYSSVNHGVNYLLYNYVICMQLGASIFSCQKKDTCYKYA